VTECTKNALCDLARTKFCELEKRWEDKYDALKESIEKSEKILGIRLEEMNNFRKQIQDERIGFMTRRESILISIIISLIIVILGAFITSLLIR
jgi:hypothetical protein